MNAHVKYQLHKNQSSQTHALHWRSEPPFIFSNTFGIINKNRSRCDTISLRIFNSVFFLFVLWNHEILQMQMFLAKIEKNFFFAHFSTSFGKYGLHYLRKAIGATRAALPSPTSACWVFLCFCNPPNSDMDYRIFNVHMWSLLCVHIYTQGLGTLTTSRHIFDSEKLSQIVLVLPIGFEPQVFGSLVRRSTNWATPSPEMQWTSPFRQTSTSVVFFYCYFWQAHPHVICCYKSDVQLFTEIGLSLSTRLRHLHEVDKILPQN